MIGETEMRLGPAWSVVPLYLVVAAAVRLLPGWGLLFFALGFGLGHIGYGLVMYNRYERPNTAGAAPNSAVAR